MRIKTFNTIKSYDSIYIYGDFNFCVSTFKYLKLTQFAPYITSIALNDKLESQMSKDLHLKYKFKKIKDVIFEENTLFLCTHEFIDELLSLNNEIDYVIVQDQAFGRFSLNDKYYMDVQITDGCNLGCRSCNHFSPLADKSIMKDINDFERDMILIKNNFGEEFINELNILGGEPLLHPQINDFLKIAKNYLPNTKMTIITNGLLIPDMPESFFDTCKANDISISFTAYQIDFDYNFYSNWLNDKGINACYGSFLIDGIEMIENISLDKSNLRDLNEAFWDCSMNCLLLNDSRLYRCSVSAYYKYFNEYFGEHLDEDVENGILLENRTKYDILDEINEPCSFCKYCHPIVIEPWGLSKHDISEWTTPEYASKYNQLNKQ